MLTYITTICLMISLLFGYQKAFMFLNFVEQKSRTLDKEDFVLTFIDVKKYRNIECGCVYADVLNHSRASPYGDKHGRYTNVHETAHSIHNELRNEYKQKTKKKVNALYALQGQAIIIDDPNIKITDIIDYVPKNLRSRRFKTYFIDQNKHWNDVPTYILDEWVCYILGAECGIDDFDRKVKLEKTNAVSGSIEFSIYALAMCLSIKEKDPEFWKNNEQFKAAIKYNLIRSEKAFNAGLSILEFKDQEQERLQQELMRSEEAKDLREILLKDFDGIFLPKK